MLGLQRMSLFYTSLSTWTSLLYSTGVFSLRLHGSSRRIRLAAKTKENIPATLMPWLHGNLHIRRYNFCLGAAYYRISRGTLIRVH